MESYQGADECGEQARVNLREIAEETGKALRDALHKRGDDEVVDARPAERVSSVDGYHALSVVFSNSGINASAKYWRVITTSPGSLCSTSGDP